MWQTDGNAIHIYKGRAGTHTVAHNTLDDNIATVTSQGNGIYVNDIYDLNFVTNVSDNLVTNHNGYGIATSYGAIVNYSYNDLWQNTKGATDGSPVDGGGNISADPLYNADYTLQSGSPCIGAGSDGQDIGVVFDACGCAPPVTEVTIDIKPSSYPNSINLGSKGVVPVAVLTTDDFDAGTVDPATVVFAGASPVRWMMGDVDGDGDVDMLFHFKTQDLDLNEGSTGATLTGQTTDGQAIQGTDLVNIVPASK